MYRYDFYVGSYQKNTTHLSPMEDLIYRRLLDYYYTHESPLPNDPEKLFRITKCENKEMKKAIFSVTTDEHFFHVSDDGKYLINDRAEVEIEKFRKSCDRNKIIAINRETNKKNNSTTGATTGLTNGAPGVSPDEHHESTYSSSSSSSNLKEKIHCRIPKKNQGKNPNRKNPATCSFFLTIFLKSHGTNG